MKKLFAYLFVTCISASVASADFLTALDGFEADTAGNPPATARGWNTTGVTVSNSNAHTGNNAAYFTTDAVATNSIGELTPSKAWTDFRIKPALGAEPLSPPTNTATALFFFDADGYVNVWNNGDWTICSNNLWNTEVDAVSNAYVWISIYQNFTDKKYALFLNDELLIQDVPFVKTDLTAYNSFVVQNVDSNAYLDNVWINASYYEEGNHSFDKNGRAGVDVVEVDTYGYAGRTLYVNGTGSELPTYSTLASALADARDHDIIDISSLAAGETITLDGTANDKLSALTFVGDDFSVAALTVTGVALTFSNSVTVVGTLTTSSDITLANGTDLAAATLDIQSDATVTGTDGSEIAVENLDMVAGTTINVTSGSITDSTTSFSMNGTFTIDGGDWHTWGGSGTIAQTLPMTDNFDRYTAGNKISAYGIYGWGASSDSVTVQSAVKVAGNALMLPDGTTASNEIDSATGAIWTEYYLRPMLGARPADSTTTGKSFMSYTDTNGFMVVYTDGDWETCNVNLAGDTSAKLTTNNFKRIVIYQDFSSSKFALFVDRSNNESGSLELVAQKKSFPETQASLNHFVINNTDNTAYLDSISISTTAPTGSADLDDDGMPDVEEISLNGSTLIYPNGLGTIFRFI